MKASNTTRSGRQVNKRDELNQVKPTVVTEQSRSPLVHHPPKNNDQNNQEANPSTEKLDLHTLTKMLEVIQKHALAPRDFRSRLAATVDRLFEREPVAALRTLQQLLFAAIIGLVLCFTVLAAILFFYKAEVSTLYQLQDRRSKPDAAAVNDAPHSVASREVVDKALVKD